MNKFPIWYVGVGPVQPSRIYKVHRIILVKFTEQNVPNHVSSLPQDVQNHPEEALTQHFLQKIVLQPACMRSSFPRSLIPHLSHTIPGDMKIIPMESE
jgi:hypothetical protein